MKINIGFDDMASSKPLPSSRNDLNINIRKRNILKERRKKKGGYGLGLNRDDDMDNGNGAMGAPKHQSSPTTTITQEINENKEINKLNESGGIYHPPQQQQQI